MELRNNFSQFLSETASKNGFVRKILNLNITKKELDVFFETIQGKSFKSVNGDFKKEFSKYFQTEFKQFQTAEANFLKAEYTTATTGRAFVINAVQKSGNSNSPKDVSINAPVQPAEKTTVKDMNKGKLKKFKVPTSKGDKFESFVEKVIMSLLGNSKGKMLLTGDPGTGKTSTIQSVMALLKLNLITIEAPHVTEENIISVPYLIKRGNTETAKTSEYKSAGGADFTVVNAESNLISELRKAKPVKDAEYAKWLNTHKLMKPMAEKYKSVIENSIKYTNVLFIDEFYRTGNKRIQNLFRTILNGKIGTTVIPANTAIIYASNMDDSDGSLDEIALNQQFSEFGFDKPSKNDFMRYMADRFTNVDVNTGEETDDESVVSKEVYNKFMDALTDDELGTKDETTEAEIRISPRRWEEIIKYVSANVPPKDLNAARQLLTFLKDNMSDYTTEETSELFDKYSKLVRDLVHESNPEIDASEITPIENKDWRNNFEGQLLAKLKMGSARKYLPVISGKPGIGKTALIDSVAKRYDLNYINIDCANLEVESVIGLTTPKENEDGTMSTVFTKPPLFEMIMAEYEKGKKPKPGSHYTHILMLDELSRTSTKVFNGLRSLMLEKLVGSTPIPEDIMIVGAMNPFDSGTSTLTDHMKDVVDVVQAEGNLGEALDYFEQTKMFQKGNKDLGFELSSALLEIFKSTLDVFRSDVNIDGEPISMNDSNFYWTDGLNVIYISPREFDDLIIGSIEDSLNILMLRHGFVQSSDFDFDLLENYVDSVKDAVVSKYETVLKFIISKQKFTETDFMDKILAHIDVFIRKDESIKTVMQTVKSEATTTFRDLFENSNGIQELLDYPEIKDILENIIDNSDVNDVISDVDTIIAETTHSANPVDIFDAVVDVYKLLSKIDWNKYSKEITSNVSSSFVLHSLKPTVQRLYDDIDSTDEPIINVIKREMKDFDTLVVMIQKAESNLFNMFV